MSTELFVIPPHPLHHLPLLVTPPSPLPPTFTTKDFLLTFPPHAATVLRSHRHHISSHQRSFHTRRLVRSAAAFVGGGGGGGGGGLGEGECGRRVDAVCDGLLRELLGKLPSAQHELIISIVCVNVLRSSSTSSSSASVDTCFVAHARFTSPFPAHVPLVTCLLHPTPQRYLPTHKHSQWIRDRAPLEVLKQSHDCGELIMTDEGASGGVREGLITSLLVEEGGGGGGGGLVGCVREGRLVGYFESLLTGDGGGGGGVSVEGLRQGKYDSVFITGTSVCIAAVSGVKWLATSGGGGGGGGQQAAGGAVQYSEASIRRVETMRQRMLATLDQHVADDKRRQMTNGVKA